jgi:xanthine/uracil permease
MNRWFSSLTMFSSVQWLFFIFANTVLVPIAVGNAFQLPPETIAMMLRTSLILTGMACMIQGWLGHKFPIMEGPSGLIWGLILNLGLSAHSLGMSPFEIGGGIATGLLLACLVSILLVVFNGVKILKWIFQPMVKSVYLFLLTFQLIFIFFEGMFKLNDDGSIHIPISLYSVAIVIFVTLLTMKGNRFISNFSILIGIVVGWIGYELIFPQEVGLSLKSMEIEWTLFPLGEPNFQIGIIVVSFIAGILNLSNSIVSIQTAASLYKQQANDKQIGRSIYITSIMTIIGTMFGQVAFTPFTSTIGFLQSTKIYNREPFILGGGLLTAIGVIPFIATFLTQMPFTVGNAVLLVAYMQLFGTAMNSLKGEVFNSNTIFRIALPILFGVSLMKVPPSIFSNLPVMIQPLISNGLIMGMLLSILLEKLVKWDSLK